MKIEVLWGGLCELSVSQFTSIKRVSWCSIGWSSFLELRVKCSKDILKFYAGRSCSRLTACRTAISFIEMAYPWSHGGGRGDDDVQVEILSGELARFWRKRFMPYPTIKLEGVVRWVIPIQENRRWGDAMIMVSSLMPMTALFHDGKRRPEYMGCVRERKPRKSCVKWCELNVKERKMPPVGVIMSVDNVWKEALDRRMSRCIDVMQSAWGTTIYECAWIQ